MLIIADLKSFHHPCNALAMKLYSPVFLSKVMLRPHLTYAVLAVWNWSLLQASFRQSRSSNGKIFGHCVIVSCNVHLRNVNDLPSKTQTSQIRKEVLRTNSIKIIINIITTIIIYSMQQHKIYPHFSVLPLSW